MKRFTLALLAIWLAVPVPVQARIQRDMICWVPDCEFPVDCDEGEE